MLHAGNVIAVGFYSIFYLHNRITYFFKLFFIRSYMFLVSRLCASCHFNLKKFLVKKYFFHVKNKSMINGYFINCIYNFLNAIRYTSLIERLSKIWQSFIWWFLAGHLSAYSYLLRVCFSCQGFFLNKSLQEHLVWKHSMYQYYIFL